MKKSMYTAVLGLFLISLVSAASQVTVIGDPNTFTGARLFIESYNGGWSDPIYPDPDQTYCSGGVVRFDVNSEKTSADIKLIFTKNGEIFMEVIKGPFDLTKNVEIDLRPGVEKKNASVESSVEAEENASVEENLTEENETEDSLVVQVEDVESVIDGEEVDLNSSDGITGFATSWTESKFTPWVFGFIGLVVVVVIVVIVAKVSYKKGVEAEMRDITRFSEMNKHLAH
jgi:hypothetical protein